MIATVTYTRRPLWLRLLRPLAIWYFSDWIRSEERHVEHLRAGGVYTAEMIAKRQSNLEPVRALLAWWQGA